MELEEGDVVLCTVDRIIGTTVFVQIEGDGEGSIVTSEIAAGRIRNLRDYVVPKKKIVCKVLRISGSHIDLSLRRVTQKEQKEVMEEYKLEKSYISILKTILKEKTEEAIKKINEKERLYDFMENAKANPKELESLAGKENSRKILEIINTQKKKIFTVKKEVLLKTTDADGINLLKKTLGEIKGIEVKYVSAGRYSLKSEASDIKTADTNLKNVISEIEKSAKKHNMEFSVAEAKPQK